MQRIAQRLLALTLAMHINILTGRPPRALAAYDGRQTRIKPLDVNAPDLAALTLESWRRLDIEGREIRELADGARYWIYGIEAARPRRPLVTCLTALTGQPLSEVPSVDRPLHGRSPPTFGLTTIGMMAAVAVPEACPGLPTIAREEYPLSLASG